MESRIRPEDINVRVEHVTHSYSGTFKAVDDVSFEIGECRITGLLGANGAGKSTLMNIICGSLTPTSGDVFINGHSIRTDAVAAKKQIGFLPQKPPLLTDLTAPGERRGQGRGRGIGKVPDYSFPQEADKAPFGRLPAKSRHSTGIDP